MFFALNEYNYCFGVFFIFYYVGLLYTCFAVFLSWISVLVSMFIIQGLLNTPSLVLYGSKNRLKTCEQFAVLNPWIPMWGAWLTALLPFYRIRRLFHSTLAVSFFCLQTQLEYNYHMYVVGDHNWQGYCSSSSSQANSSWRTAIFWGMLW